MRSGRRERKKRNLGSLDLLSFSCLGKEIFGSVEGSMDERGVNGRI